MAAIHLRLAMTYAELATAAEAAGIALRGGFHPAAEDRLPPVADERPALTVVLLGTVGRAGWDAFARSPEAGLDRDPLDRWTERVVSELAARYGARPLFPFEGPPYWPFQRWAMRAEPVAPSPIGILIHPDHGLWHAYRAALLFAERIALPERESRPVPCEACADRPCLSACPVGAFNGAGYDVEACAAHISSPAGALCMEEGCRARDACPAAPGHRYASEQIRFHMRAFRHARRPADRGDA
jgi:ferredoxin